MSTVKVSNSAAVGHASAMVKLGAPSRLSGSAAPVSDIPDMNGSGTSTDQYLPNESYSDSATTAQAFVQEGGASSAPVVAETAAMLMNSLPDEEKRSDGYSAYDNPFVSAQEAGLQLESYDKTVEAFDADALPRTTHTFG